MFPWLRMSAQADHDRAQELLAELAERDARLLRRAEERMMAAEDDAAFDGLGRTYQRLARSLRQSLALKAKLTHDRQSHIAKHSPLGTDVLRPRFDPEAADRRADELKAAVVRVARAEPPDWHEDDGPFDEDLFAAIVDDAIVDLAREDPEFLERPLDEQVAILGHLLDLSPDLAAGWRELPEAAVGQGPQGREPDAPSDTS
jgi:hypothetical protein